MADVTFTPEQQQEVNRIVAREARKAEDKGEAKAAKKYGAVDDVWLNFIDDYNRDSEKATRRLVDHVGITVAPAARDTGSQDDDDSDLTPREKRMQKELDEAKRERLEMKRMIGGFAKNDAKRDIRKSMLKDGWSKDEIKAGFIKADAYRRTRPEISLGEAFELANKKEIRETISRNLRKELDGDEYEEETPDTGAGGYDATPGGKEEPPTAPPPVKLGNEPRGGRVRKKKTQSVPDELKSTIGTIFKDEADFNKWDGADAQT